MAVNVVVTAGLKAPELTYVMVTVFPLTVATDVLLLVNVKAPGLLEVGDTVNGGSLGILRISLNVMVGVIKLTQVTVTSETLVNPIIPVLWAMVQFCPDDGEATETWYDVPGTIWV